MMKILLRSIAMLTCFTTVATLLNAAERRPGIRRDRGRKLQGSAGAHAMKLAECQCHNCSIVMYGAEDAVKVEGGYVCYDCAVTLGVAVQFRTCLGCRNKLGSLQHTFKTDMGRFCYYCACDNGLMEILACVDCSQQLPLSFLPGCFKNDIGYYCITCATGNGFVDSAECSTCSACQTPVAQTNEEFPLCPKCFCEAGVPCCKCAASIPVSPADHERIVASGLVSGFMCQGCMQAIEQEAAAHPERFVQPDDEQ